MEVAPSRPAASSPAPDVFAEEQRPALADPPRRHPARRRLTSAGSTHPARVRTVHDDSTPRHPPNRTQRRPPPPRPAGRRRGRPGPAPARQLHRRRDRELPAAHAPARHGRGRGQRPVRGEAGGESAAPASRRADIPADRSAGSGQPMRYPLRCGNTKSGYPLLDERAHGNYDHGDPENDPEFDAGVAFTIEHGSVVVQNNNNNLRLTVQHDDVQRTCRQRPPRSSLGHHRRRRASRPFVSKPSPPSATSTGTTSVAAVCLERPSVSEPGGPRGWSAQKARRDCRTGRRPGSAGRRRL